MFVMAIKVGGYRLL